MTAYVAAMSTATDIAAALREQAQAQIPYGLSSNLTDVQYDAARFAVASFGALSAMDLEALVRGQGPWTATPTGKAIDITVIRDTVRAQQEIPEGNVSGYPQSLRQAMLRPADQRPPRAATPDSPEEIEAFIADVKARM
ncbi:hypothetical protein ACWT_5837 [Actinoplanes sp. SE50]|nr:hypothetical protein ACWT_5837 [Actinoplanes sp. SE50]SLM02662.1 hypothetical protein ACSP50_5944 [Actinoplanes sp. SE50/110]